MSSHFPHPIPISWYAVCRAGDLAAGDVRAVDRVGRRLVLFRTKSGRAQVFDAYCPHLGAHLGVGGRVEGEHLVCPFHGWQFDPTGACAKVPYATRHPANARARSYPTIERNGFVWIWFDPEAGPPRFEIPELEQWASAGWEETFRKTWQVSTQIQEMGENGVDSAHFPAVHGSLEVPEAEVIEDGAHRTAIQRTEVKTSKGIASNRIEVHSIGMGFGFTQFSGIFDTVSMNLMTPIDETSTEFTALFLQPKDSAHAGVARAICKDLEQQVGEDIPIWENKRYREKPILCDGDGPIQAYRVWCQQFYQDATTDDPR